MDIIALLHITAALILLLLVGILANKIGVIDSAASKMLSKLIIRIGQPLLIISAIMKVEYSRENLLLGLETFAIGFVVYAIMSVIAYLACRGMRDQDDRKVTETAMILGNVGFFGFPLLEATLGPTGLFMALPEGYEAQVRPRSGLAIKKGITVLNSPGTIDADYRGEVCVILVNLSSEPFIITDGERIAQMVIARHEQVEWSEVEVLDDTERGAGGFGHTGV